MKKNQFSCFNIALIDVFFFTICLQLQKNANALITVAVNFSKKGRTTTKHSKHIPRQNVVTVTVLCCICHHTGRHLLELIAVLSDFCCYFFSAANEEKCNWRKREKTANLPWTLLPFYKSLLGILSRTAFFFCSRFCKLHCSGLKSANNLIFLQKICKLKS